MLNWLRKKLKSGTESGPADKRSTSPQHNRKENKIQREKTGNPLREKDLKSEQEISEDKTVLNKTVEEELDTVQKNSVRIPDMYDSLLDVTVIKNNEDLIKDYVKRLDRKKEVQNILQNVGAALNEGNKEKFNRTIIRSLERIGEFTKADRVQLWCNELVDGNLYFKKDHEWLSEMGTRYASSMKSLTYAYDEVPGWENKLKRGKLINCPIVDLLPHEYDFYNSQKTKTLIVIPLFVSNEFWGFIRVDDCTQSRIFTEDILEDINSIGQFLVLALILGESLDAINIERKKTAEQAHWYRSILDAIPVPISVTDVDMAWTFVNTAVESLIGMKRDTIYGMPCSTMGTEICNTHDCGISCAKRYVDRTFFNSAGKSYQVDVSKLTNLGGDTVGYVEVMQDVTMLRIQRDLAILAREHAESVKSEFLANMGHELRTPMNSIVGFSELALVNEAPPKVKDYLTKILLNSELLLQIINDLLDISKLEFGKLKLEVVPFNIHELLGPCKNIFAEKAKEKGLDLSYYIDPSINDSLLGDPARLRQALTNLLSNAIKFTNNGDVNIKIYTKESSEDKTKIYFEVKDSGIGITPQQIAVIFDPFAQANTGTTRNYRGTGLGLSIANNIIELMGGKVSVESIAGAGSTFSFELSFDVVRD